jgi:hypothetical protein
VVAVVVMVLLVEMVEVELGVIELLVLVQVLYKAVA